MSASFDNIVKNLFKMLTARGYDMAGINPPLEDETEFFVEDIIIFFCHNAVNTEMVEYIIKKTKAEELGQIIIIAFGKITPPAKAILAESGRIFDIQIFDHKELGHDKTENRLVFPHRLISEEEEKDLLEKYRVKKIQLPHITSIDPQVKYHGWKKGGIVEITRPSGIYYRLIV